MAHIIFIKTFNQCCLIRDIFHVKLSRLYQITELSETYLQIGVAKENVILLQDIRGTIKTFSFCS